MAQRQNRWFQPKDGISREVIQADIQRYLGRDATVRPGDDNGVQGYWITAYRTLTTEMVRDLQLDSRRWEAEIAQGRERYTESATHRSRQYYGPSETPAPEAPSYSHASGYSQPYAQPQTAYPADRGGQRAVAQTGYAAAGAYGSDSAYTYGSQSQQYQQPSAAYAAPTAQYSPSSYSSGTPYSTTSSYGSSNPSGYSSSTASQPRTAYGYQTASSDTIASDPYARSGTAYQQQPTQTAYQYPTGSYPAAVAATSREHLTSAATQSVSSPTTYAYPSSSHTGYGSSSRDPPRHR